MRACPKCNGYGRTDSERCVPCDGTGRRLELLPAEKASSREPTTFSPTRQGAAAEHPGGISTTSYAPLCYSYWSWRKELAFLGYAAIIFIAVVRTFGIAWTIIGTSVTLVILPLSWSERLTAFAWQLITPHLLRSGMYQARIQNRDGRQPVIIRITSEPFGERLRLWCPAGTSAEDLYAARGILRAACRAADVKVTRDQQRSHIVTLDVIRRPHQTGPADGGRGTTRCGLQ